MTPNHGLITSSTARAGIIACYPVIRSQVSYPARSAGWDRRTKMGVGAFTFNPPVSLSMSRMWGSAHVHGHANSVSGLTKKPRAISEERTAQHPSTFRGSLEHPPSPPHLFHFRREVRSGCGALGAFVLNFTIGLDKANAPHLVLPPPRPTPPGTPRI